MVEKGMEITPLFVEAVYRVVATIPRGKVMTYGQVAELAGMPGAAREVGTIMSRVPASKNLPCHRVVNKTGRCRPTTSLAGRTASAPCWKRRAWAF